MLYRAVFIICLIGTFASGCLGLAEAGTIIRRAAFDIGSAVTKCTVADVDTETGEIVKIVFEDARKVDFAEDMARSYDWNFSREILDEGKSVLEGMKKAALGIGAMQFSAVGGSVFYQARNGRAYFSIIEDELGIKCRILSKEQASLISYHSVRHSMKDNDDELLVWDIGGALQTMTTRRDDGGMLFFSDQMASVSFKNAVIIIIQGKDVNQAPSPNPVSRDEVDRALQFVRTHAQLNMPSELINRIQSGMLRIAGIGGVHYYAVPELLGRRFPYYTRTQVRDALDQWTGKEDDDFKSPFAPSRLTNLILVLGYMEALEITRVYPFKVNLTHGVLVSPEFW